MGIDDLKRARGAQRSGGSRTRPLTAAILTVVEVNKEEGRLTVLPAPNTAQALGGEPGQPVDFTIRDDPKTARQPNLNDLLGAEGRAMQASMEVVPGSAFRAEGLQLNEDGLSARWVNLVAGPNAPEVELLSGWVRTAHFKDKEGKTRNTLSVVNADAATAVASAEDTRQAVEAAMAAEGLGRGFAYIRASGEGGTVHSTARQRWLAEEERRETPVEAAQRTVGEDNVQAMLNDGDVTVEVIPARTLPIGGYSKEEINEAVAEQTASGKAVSGHKGFPVAEIHPNDRTPDQGGGEGQPSPATVGFVNAIAGGRGRHIPPAAVATQAGATAFITQNRVMFGHAPGQVAVQTRTGDEGNTYHVATGAALHRRSGLPLDAIPTAACPDAQERARALSSQAAKEREELLSATPAAAGLDAGLADASDLTDEADLDAEEHGSPASADDFAP